MTERLPICENCGSETGIRRILWGLPSSEPDFDEYVIGGCMPGENPASLRCIDCGWENDQPRWKRFQLESTEGISILCQVCHEWVAAKNLPTHKSSHQSPE